MVRRNDSPGARKSPPRVRAAGRGVGVSIPHVSFTGVYGSSTNVSHGRAGLDCVVPTCNWVLASSYTGRTHPCCVTAHCAFPDVPSSSLPGLRQQPATTLWCCDKSTATHAAFAPSLLGVAHLRRPYRMRHSGRARVVFIPVAAGHLAMPDSVDTHTHYQTTAASARRRRLVARACRLVSTSRGVRTASLFVRAYC